MGQQIGLVTNGRDAADRIRQEGWDFDIRTRDAARQAASMSTRATGCSRWWSKRAAARNN